MKQQCTTRSAKALSGLLVRHGWMGLMLAASPAMAMTLVDESEQTINLNIEAGVGQFHSGERYNVLGGSEEGSADWTEGYLNLELQGEQKLSNSALYGGIGTVTSFVAGDGDAAGFSDGSESKTDLERLYVGWKSGSLIAALPENGLDLSVGQQNFVVGDGFIINSDGLNGGKGLGDDYNRGGGYYMAPRRSFDQTFIARVQASESVKADLFYLDSGNALQGEVNLTGANVEYSQAWGTVGVMAVSAESTGDFAQEKRDGQSTTSVRYQGNAGVEGLFLSSELVTQSQGDSSDDGSAGYVEAGWTFAEAPYAPVVTYRYSHFSENYDPLLYGFNRGFGTWFQGEVTGNYAGPFSTNADIHHLGLKASLAENLTLGANGFVYSAVSTDDNDYSGTELDFYAEYFPNENFLITPLLGLYTPDESSANGGSQIGSTDTNVYAQMMVIAFY